MNRDARPLPDNLILGPCAGRFRSAEELLAQLVPTASAAVTLSSLERDLLLKLGGLMYASWDLPWKVELDSLGAGGERELALATLTAMGLIEDLGDKLNLSNAGCETWALLDSRRGQDAVINVALNSEEARLMSVIRDAAAIGYRLPATPLAAPTGRALDRLLALRLIRLEQDRYFPRN